MMQAAHRSAAKTVTFVIAVALSAKIEWLAADPPTGADPAKWTDARIQCWRPTAAEKSFDEIGWVANIQTALRLAKEQHRPVFLFTHDGRMGIGRC